MDNNFQPRTHGGGLYCSEGSTHVNRPSVRVREPPGGGSSWNFLQPMGPTSTATTATTTASTAPSYDSNDNSYRARKARKEGEVAGKIGHAPMPAAQEPTHTQSYEPAYHASATPAASAHEQSGFGEAATGSNDNAALGAIYCVEGSQVRTRPSVKIRGEPRRNYNIIG